MVFGGVEVTEFALIGVESTDETGHPVKEDIAANQHKNKQILFI